jgi:hypothetical protein
MADTSIYGLIKPVQAPSMMESAKGAATLKSLAMQQDAQAQEMDQAKVTAHLQKAAAFGDAMEGLAKVPEAQRPQAYSQMYKQMSQAGIITPDQAPPEYDPQFHAATVARYQQTKPYLEKNLMRSQAAENFAQAEQAKHKATGSDDPLARQMAMMNARDQLDQQKKQREIQQYSQVGGWKLSDGATPTADDAKKFKTGAAAARSLLSNLNEYQGLVDKYGSEVGGKVAQRMDSLVRDIQLSAKNEDLYGLGVLTGPDLALLEEVVGSAPTGVTSKLNPFAGSKASNKAQQFREMVNTRMNSKAKTYGFEPQDEWKALARGGSPSPSGGSPLGGSDAVAAPPAIKPGTVEDGHVYMGGDPGNPSSWKKTGAK